MLYCTSGYFVMENSDRDRPASVSALRSGAKKKENKNTRPKYGGGTIHQNL